jgi:integrase
MDYAFPLIRRYAKLTIMLKVVLKRSGKDTTIPTHIFRHTFAQDALDATDHNYELVASIGGWDSTAILKKHYGQMSDNANVKGLRKMMGIKVDEVEKPLILKW